MNSIPPFANLVAPLWLTPLCKRNLNHNPASSKIICVNSSGGFDKSELRLFVFTTPFIIGGLPIAYAICNSEKEDKLSELFRMIRVIFTF